MVVILEPHRIAYFPIPKVANTSIRGALLAAVGDEAFHNSGNRGMSPLLRRLARGCWKFAVVRDPLARALSGYGNRVVHHRDIRRAPVSRTLLKLRGLPPEPDLDTFFSHLQSYMAVNDRVRRHMLLQRRYLGGDLGYFDRIYRIEEVPQLAADLSERLGTEVTIGREQTGGPKFRRADLSARAESVLRDYLAPDYGLLSEYYRAPW